MCDPAAGPRAPLTTVTSTALLQGLRDPNRTLWGPYVDRYRPVVVALARRAGLGADDAEDVAQESLAEFAREYVAGRYDRARGRLRSWLFGIAANRVREVRARARRVALQGDGVAVEGLAASDDLESLWEAEWRTAVLRQCLREVDREFSDTTRSAFERYVLRGQPAESVAAELGLSANAVYTAKRRVLRRLREFLPAMEDAW